MVLRCLRWRQGDGVMAMVGRLVKEALLRLFAMIYRDDSPKVVFYHDVGKTYTPMGTDAKVFWGHMACLRPADVVCFDDGFRGIWDEREEFAKLQIKPIVFIAIALVDREGYLTWDEIRALQNDYGFDFQCHTWSHQTLAGPYNNEVPEPLNGRTEEWYRHELIDSKVELERQLGMKVTELCFPVGYFSDDIIRRCKEAGYQKVYASYPGNVTDEYVQPRCLVQGLSVALLMATLSGGLLPLAKRYRRMHVY